MKYDATYKVINPDNVDDLTYDRFRSELLSYDSPILRESRMCYDTIRRFPVSTRAIVAMAIHDSSLSTQGINVKYNTKNPGNTRSSSTGKGREIETEKGTFVKFDKFYDGFEDMCNRLIDSDYPYINTDGTLRNVIYKYAPPTDDNDTENYIVSVCNIMESLDMGPDRYSKIADLPVVWIPAPLSNYNSGHGPYELIVIHDIEGSAQSGINTLSDPTREASVQFINDPEKNRVVQMVGTKDTAWGAGNDKANDNGLHIENPGFAGKPYPDKTIINCGKIVGQLSVDFNIPLIRLTPEQANTPGIKGICGHGDMVQHGPRTEWHWDPGHTWKWELMMQTARETAGVVEKTPPFRFWFAESGFGIFGGFARRWAHSGGISGFGYPRSREHDIIENGRLIRVQWFDKARFEWVPGQYPDMWDVTINNLGYELLTLPPQYFEVYLQAKHNPLYTWAFTPQSVDEWNERGHDMPQEMVLFS